MFNVVRAQNCQKNEFLVKKSIFSVKNPVMACHVITAIRAHKIRPEASHITQSVTQPKTLKLPKITQKNTKFKAVLGLFSSTFRLQAAVEGLFSRLMLIISAKPLTIIILTQKP